MTKTLSMPPAPSQSLHLTSKRPQKPSSDRACLQALTGAGYASSGAGHKLCQHLPTILQLPCWTAWVSGLAFPLSIKHARHLHFLTVFYSLGEHPGHQGVRYLGWITPVLCSLSPSLLLSSVRGCDSLIMESRETPIPNKEKCWERKTISCPGL